MGKISKSLDEYADDLEGAVNLLAEVREKLLRGCAIDHFVMRCREHKQAGPCIVTTVDTFLENFSNEGRE